nr:MAG TPA: hypothetical protein [Caudoviricetes sp.]
MISPGCRAGCVAASIWSLRCTNAPSAWAWTPASC